MRFTLKTYNGREFRNAVFNDRPPVFSQDLIFYIFRTHHKDWLPLGHKTYAIHTLSPLTYKVRQAISLLLENKEEEYNMKYEKVAAASDEKLVKFASHIRQIFDIHYARTSISINDSFDTLLYIARLSLTFFEKGVRDAPFLANEMMTSFLDTLPPNIYGFMNWHAENVLAAKSRTAPSIPSE